MVAIIKLNEEEPKPEIIDPNAILSELEQKVPALNKEARACFAALKSEEPGAGDRIKKLSDDIQNWMESFDRELEDKRDDQGRIKEEFGHYSNVRSRVNQLRVDVLKATPF